jgi:hypothetical protein
MIYVIKTHSANLSNLFQAIMLQSAGQSAYKPCKFLVTPEGFFELVLGDFVKQVCSDDPATNFRRINWADCIDDLHQLHRTINQHLIFGSHRADQIDYLKTQFGQNLTTIAINYSVDTYPLLIENMARYHVYLLINKIIQPTVHDTDLMKFLSKQELVYHYQGAFDQMKLIPTSCQDTFDYSIDIADFVDKEKVGNHLAQLGLALSSSASSMYNEWITKYTQQ